MVIGIVKGMIVDTMAYLICRMIIMYTTVSISKIIRGHMVMYMKFNFACLEAALHDVIDKLSGKRLINTPFLVSHVKAWR